MAEPFVYLDYNATTPVDPRVIEAMRPALASLFGNPSSGHRPGRAARAAVEEARERVAACLGAESDEIVFTSGGSESDNQAIHGVVAARGGGHVVVSAVEHPAVLEPARALAAEGRIRLTVVPVDRFGRVDPDEIERALAADTVLVSVMLANNEVGTLEPVAEIAARCRRRGVLVHTDAAQAVGKVPVDVGTLGVDLLTVAGHKLYAPKGIGALFVRRGVELAPLIRGAGHERGLRSGTENVASIVGLGVACSLAAAELAEERERLAALRDRLEAMLAEGFPALVRHGHPVERLPNTASVAFPGVDANLLLTRLADEVGASAGAACHTDAVHPSAVLLAMGVDAAMAMSTVRFSVGRFSTADEVERAARRVVEVARELAGDRATSSAAPGPGVRLTRFTHGLGCACKLQPRLLEEVVRRLPRPQHAEILVGAFRRRLRVAAAGRHGAGPDTRLLHAGGRRATAVRCDRRGQRALRRLRDGRDPAVRPQHCWLPGRRAAGRGAARDPGRRAGGRRGSRRRRARRPHRRGHRAEVRLGRHRHDRRRPALAQRRRGADQLWRNAGAREGDLLVLTKPLGVGIWATAAKHDAADAAGWARACATMRRLNAAGAAALRPARPRAVTDVTGFGLLGHLHELLAASRCDGEVWLGAVPVLDGTRRLIALGEVPGGTRANLEHAAAFTSFAEGIVVDDRLLLADAQTSGGLLAAVPADAAGPLLERLHDGGDDGAAIVGRITGPGDGRVRVLDRRD
ncbi:MAG: selenium donor protein/cysteine desulfurase NifS,TIGR03402 [Acidobacteria bacterium]|nr:selenium donor protein/cysteine desulfurase NifS,TIGR03402 [Acidobacteriota bacterium]